jgi:hypothetical protein
MAALTHIGGPGNLVIHSYDPVAILDYSSQVSVYEFGANGNGTTDDAVAIQAGITALAGAGVALVFTAGTFYVNSAAITNTAGVPITIMPGATFTGTYASSMQALAQPNRARNVVTSLAAYAGTGTATLTASANGAWATQDGITNAVGDTVFAMPGTTNLSAAADSGPWTIVSLGASGAKWVLTRPSWFAQGSLIVQGLTIVIGGEATSTWGNNEFRATCGQSKVVGTNDPAFYPKTYRKTVTLAAGTYTVGAGGGGEALALLSTTTSSVQLAMNTGAGTLGTNKLGAPVASRVAGYSGTAAVVVNSYIDAGTVASSDTSTVDVLVTNW